MSEKVTGFHSNDYGTIFITNQRVIGFPPLLGSFASKPLGCARADCERGWEAFG